MIGGREEWRVTSLGDGKKKIGFYYPDRYATHACHFHHLTTIPPPPQSETVFFGRGVTTVSISRLSQPVPQLTSSAQTRIMMGLIPIPRYPLARLPLPCRLSQAAISHFQRANVVHLLGCSVVLP